MLGNAKKVGKKRWKMEKEMWKKWNNRWKKKRSLILIIDFDVEKSRQKNWTRLLIIDFDVEKSRQKKGTRLWNAIYYAFLKKTVEIEDYNFE